MRFLLVGLSVAVLWAPAWGWWPRGHGILTRAALRVLPAEAPAFLRAGDGMVAHAAVDPDVAKNRGTLHLERANHPTHYFNVELLAGRELPASRYDYERLCAELGQTPEKVGTLPYVTAEWTEQLALAFAEYRKWPEHPFVQNKCLVYAGLVAHYAQEVCQPLNLTIHWNGWVVDGKPPNTRIHEKVDSLIQELGLQSDSLAVGLTAAPLDSLMGGIVAQIEAGHQRVEGALALERAFSAEGDAWKQDAAVQAFAREQGRAAARFTASLYMTAWQLSAKIRLPGWIDRKEMDHLGTP